MKESLQQPEQFLEPVRPRIASSLLEAREDHKAIKLFYALMREMRQTGGEIIDISSTVEPNEIELAQLNELIEISTRESIESRHFVEYSSSWGSMELRQATADFFKQWGDVDIDPIDEVMVTGGIINGFRRFISALDSTHLVVPSLTMYYPRSFGIQHGKTIVEAPLNVETGNLDLDVLEQKLKDERAERGSILMHIINPAAPSGSVMSEDFIQNSFIPFCKQKGIFVFVDGYVTATRLDGSPIKPFLSFTGAKDIAIEAVTVSKELGLPGARAGSVAGNPDLIAALRILAATEIDTVSGASMHLAAKALRELDAQRIKDRLIQEMHHDILPRFKHMGWPIIEPKAGIDMLVAVPPGYFNHGLEDPSLIASFSFMRRFGVAFSPGSVFGKDGKNFLRLVFKVDSGKIARALEQMQQLGFDWATDQPSEEDIRFIDHLFSTLDLTKL